MSNPILAGIVLRSQTPEWLWDNPQVMVWSILDNLLAACRKADVAAVGVLECQHIDTHAGWADPDEALRWEFTPDDPSI